MPGYDFIEIYFDTLDIEKYDWVLFFNSNYDFIGLDTGQNFGFSAVNFLRHYSC